MKEMQEMIVNQVAATDGWTSLTAHRDLVQNRWDQLRSFALSDVSPQKLSPNAKKLKHDFFDDGGARSKDLFKNYRKRFSGFVQSLVNASDRLNEVQREECFFLFAWNV